MADYGEITTEEGADVLGSDAHIPGETIYRWRPPPDLVNDFPADRAVELSAFTINGVRRFAWHGGVERYIQFAWAGGLAIMARDRELSPEQVQSYRQMKLVFDRIRMMQDHLRRQLHSVADLAVRRSGRMGGGEETILPDGLGGTGRNSEPWSIPVLLERGIERAKYEGLDHVSQSDKIRYGLLAAAELDPLLVNNEEATQLVRMALFDAERIETDISDDVLREVLERIVAATLDHIDDDTEGFNRFFGPRGNLLKRLATMPDRPLGRLDHGVVRGAFVQLGWQSYVYVADCLNYFAAAFANCLPSPLDNEERRFFYATFRSQDYFGGLPLPLIMERLWLIEPVLDQLMQHPQDKQLVGVLHRLLQYYAEMATRRKAADRQTKDRANAVTVSLDDVDSRNTMQPQRVETDDSVHDLVIAAVKRRKIGCPSCDGEVTLHYDVTTVEQQQLRVEGRCAQHGTLDAVVLTFEELRQEAQGEQQ